MQYAVPQFVEVEDKVIGPLTVRQFLIMLAGGGASLIAYKTCDMGLFILLTIVFMGISAALAFVKLNGQPLPRYARNAYKYLTKPKMLVWAHDPKLARALASEKTKRARPKIEEVVLEREYIPKSKLKELSSILDTYGEAVAREEEKVS